ncbi:sialic acid synthase [Cylas formicarius]|uniref:sialic acid synthase n=1 Tax=Cylas formicarius TaxID=197179 RepID=UPI002958607E|nr:sialic acid synthase [Cylas formicarius]
MEFLDAIKKGKRTFVVAEIGQNHQGDIGNAKKLIDVAMECGADCAKFQKTCIAEKFTRSVLEAPYVSPNSWGATYGDHKAHLEFSDDEFRELQRYCQEVGVMFAATPMDCASLDFLVGISVPFIKIGSGDANNFVLLEKAARTELPLVISTGMQDFGTVKSIYKLVSKHHKKFALLHCVSSYPAPLHQLNLEVINLYKREFPDVVVGYSGHELGTKMTLAAAAMGAKIVERHITLDKSWKGTDHKCSLSPREFKSLVDDIRALELAMGEPVKKRLYCEQPTYKKLGKSLVFAQTLKAGHEIATEDVTVKVCTPKGVDPTEINNVIGKRLNCDVYADNPILDHHIK